MQALIGAKPLEVSGVRATAGAVMPRAAVAATATTATVTCLITVIFRLGGASREGTVPLCVMNATLRHRNRRVANATPTGRQSILISGRWNSETGSGPGPAGGRSGWMDSRWRARGRAQTLVASPLGS